MGAQQIQSIAVVGATGFLAVPVVKALVEAGYAVRGLIRDEAKAKKLLPDAVELVAVDLQKPETLEAGLRGQDAVYVNLTTETDRLDLPWYQEREGVRAVVDAAQKNELRHIYKIGGAWPKEIKVVSAIIPREGNRAIHDSGIPYTIFDPTMFFDNFERQVKAESLQWVGPTRGSKFWWVAADDYAAQVVAAVNDPRANNRHYVVQGPELLTAQDAFDRFKAVYNPKLKVKALPLFVAKLLGFFNAEMAFVAHLYDGFNQFNEEEFNAKDTWDDLGKPQITAEEYGRRLKEKKSSLA